MGNRLNLVKATVNDFYRLGLRANFDKLSQFWLVTFVNLAVGFSGIAAPAFSQTYNQETQLTITPIQPSIIPIQPRITPVDLQKNQLVQPRSNQRQLSPVPPAQSNSKKQNDELPVLIYRCSNPVTCQLPLISI
ncbi:MAG TPA: hypothetical protein VIQ31_02940 [Phormidium sp.]